MSEFEEAEARIDDLEDDLNEAYDIIADREHELADVTEEIEEIREERDNALEDLQDAQSELDESEDDLMRLEGNFDSLQDEYDDLYTNGPDDMDDRIEAAHEEGIKEAVELLVNLHNEVVISDSQFTKIMNEITVKHRISDIIPGYDTK